MKTEGTQLRIRKWVDWAAQHLMLNLTWFAALLAVAVAAGLYWKAMPILDAHPWKELLLSSKWSPMRHQFGLLPFLAGTFWVTLCAVVIAVPLSLLTAVYLSEYAGRNVRKCIVPLIDLLAGIPSVVFGVWGVLTIVPLVKNVIAPAMGRFSSGYCILSAGLVLAIMVLPVIIHVSLEVLQTVPRELREASWSLGATKWETVKKVVVRKALPGLFAANMLGLSRAFGETMAVLMVAGNVARMPRGPLDPAYPLPALIANNYGEMMSIPLYDAALLLSALLLFVIVLVFSLLSRLILVRVERGMH